MTIVFNLLLLASGAAAVRFVRKSPTPVPALVALFWHLVAAGVLSMVFGGGTFGMMRLFAWALFAHVPLFLLAVAFLLRRANRWSAATCVAGVVLIAAVGVDAFLVEPHWLEVSYVRIESRSIEWKMRIAVVADLQTDQVGEYERDVVRRLMAEKPDMILFAGDYVQVHDAAVAEKTIQDLNALFKEEKLYATRGIYAVAGNVDFYKWQDIFEGLDVTVVRATRTFESDGDAVTGLGVEASFNPALKISHEGNFHIALGHSPNFALGDVRADLLIAGHTHGGQVRLPFIGPLMTLSQVPRSWAAGVTKLGNGRTLVVSRGVGMERGAAPRLRFLCRPELVIIDVTPSKSFALADPDRLALDLLK